MINIYNEIKEEMRTGDILQWQSYSIIGSLIRWKTKVNDVSKEDMPNHSSMIIRLSEWEGLERRRYHTEAMERGVYPNILSNRISNFQGKIWWLPLKEEWNEKREEIGMRLIECWGKEYDYKSLAWQLIGKVSIDVRKMFCSEVVKFALVGEKGIAPNPVELEKYNFHKFKKLFFDSK